MMRMMMMMMMMRRLPGGPKISRASALQCKGRPSHIRREEQEGGGRRGEQEEQEGGGRNKRSRTWEEQGGAWPLHVRGRLLHIRD